MTQISRILIVFASLVGLALGQRCKVPVPFSSRLVGRTFFKFDDCYRPSTSSEVRVFSGVFVYLPTILPRHFIGKCEEKYVFHFRRDGKDPFVVHFPSLDHPDPSSVSDDEEFEEFCEKEQRKIRKKFFPLGETRKMFRQAVRTIVTGALEIRDFGCEEDERGFFVQVPGRAFVNVDLDGVITYLLGVGYQYNFCAESG